MGFNPGLRRPADRDASRRDDLDSCKRVSRLDDSVYRLRGGARAARAWRGRDVPWWVTDRCRISSCDTACSGGRTVVQWGNAGWCRGAVNCRTFGARSRLADCFSDLRRFWHCLAPALGTYLTSAVPATRGKEDGKFILAEFSGAAALGTCLQLRLAGDRTGANCDVAFGLPQCRPWRFSERHWIPAVDACAFMGRWVFLLGMDCRPL